MSLRAVSVTHFFGAGRPLSSASITAFSSLKPFCGAAGGQEVCKGLGGAGQPNAASAAVNRSVLVEENTARVDVGDAAPRLPHGDRGGGRMVDPSRVGKQAPCAS